ncbi:uncharacterized protein TNCV_3728021 [Trichonephila clavipes]|uniref:Uncharacterized protein n=1 Tax=Trichonephila clavipes TaxID=2585209 RepID=A0A8X6UT03_TRICX|nr:uncharacterized protein TNCV_3728021 [Trichonephila clavipes]
MNFIIVVGLKLGYIPNIHYDSLQTQILEARQLFPFRSYKDVQLFHYTIPNQVTFASFQYKANGSFHCPSKTVAVYLQYGSYPVMSLQNSTYPNFFAVHRLFLHNIVLHSDFVPVMINITNPLPGNWYAAAFLIENTERIAQKGLFTPCLSWLSSSLKFTTAENVISLLQETEMSQMISSTQLYRSRVRIPAPADLSKDWNFVLSPVLYRAPSVRINLIVCLIELCTSFELRDKFGGGAGYNYVKRG